MCRQEGRGLVIAERMLQEPCVRLVRRAQVARDEHLHGHVGLSRAAGRQVQRGLREGHPVRRGLADQLHPSCEGVSQGWRDRVGVSVRRPEPLGEAAALEVAVDRRRHGKRLTAGVIHARLNPALEVRQPQQVRRLFPVHIQQLLLRARQPGLVGHEQVTPLRHDTRELLRPLGLEQYRIGVLGDFQQDRLGLRIDEGIVVTHGSRRTPMSRQGGPGTSGHRDPACSFRRGSTGTRGRTRAGLGSVGGGRSPPLPSGSSTSARS